MDSDLIHRTVQNTLLNNSNLSFVDNVPFIWEIKDISHKFFISEDCKYIHYYYRVLELCVRKYLRSFSKDLGKDIYTELFINEGISNTAIRRTFIDHNEDFLWHERPYDVGCCKFLALSSMVYGTDFQNLEHLIDDLPQINDLRLVEILENIKPFICYPKRIHEGHVYDCRSSKSFILRIDETPNAGYFFQIIITKDENIHLKAQYELALYMLSYPNFNCRNLFVYNPLMGKSYSANCDFDRAQWCDKFKELKQQLCSNLKLI